MKTKKGAERKNEILDKAEFLFATRGYEHTTIVDILDAVGIGKGTFYYHYKSKEEVLDAIILRRCEMGAEAAMRFVEDRTLDVHEKLLRIVLAQKPVNETQKQLIETLHEPSNALMHQKCMTKQVCILSPVLEKVVKEGIAKGVFSTPYPRDSMEILLTAGLTVFDDGYFQWDPEEMERKMHAFLLAMERVLGAEEGSLSYLRQCFDLPK